MNMCNVKGVTRSDEPKEIYHQTPVSCLERLNEKL